jgi:hypothetical protein
MWTWLPQSLVGWALLLSLSAASLFVGYETILLRLNRRSKNLRSMSASSLTVTGGGGSKTTSNRKATS